MAENDTENINKGPFLTKLHSIRLQIKLETTKVCRNKANGIGWPQPSINKLFPLPSWPCPTPSCWPSTCTRESYVLFRRIQLLVIQGVLYVKLRKPTQRKDTLYHYVIQHRNDIFWTRQAIISCFSVILVIASDDVKKVHFLLQPISEKTKRKKNIYAHWDHYWQTPSSGSYNK